MKFLGDLNNRAVLMSIVALLLSNTESVQAVNNAKYLSVSSCNSCAVGNNYFCQPEGETNDGVLCCSQQLPENQAAPTVDELSRCDPDNKKNNCTPKFSSNPASFYS